MPLRLPFLSSFYDEKTNATVALNEVGTLHLHRDWPPLALLEPVTFVASARSMHEALAAMGVDDRAPWLSASGIADPTAQEQSKHRLSPAHYEILTRYIRDLYVFVAGSSAVAGEQNIAPVAGVKERLTASGAPVLARTRVNALSGLLNQFWKDAQTAARERRAQLGVQAAVYKLVTASRHDVTSFNDPLYGPTRLQAFRVAEQDEDDGVRSHTEIETRREAAGLFRAVVLADSQIALGDSQHVLVLDDTTVMHLREQSDRALILQRESRARNVLVVTPDDLFTDTLVQISNGTVPGHTRRGVAAN